MSLLYAATIPGNPIVKKNNQKVSFRGRYPRKYNTPQYKQWSYVAEQTIMNVYGRPDRPVDYPVLLVCKFFMQTKRRVDLSALYEGIQDVLVKCSVLEDDNFNIIAGHDGSRVLLDRENPRLELEIHEFTG